MATSIILHLQSVFGSLGYVLKRSEGHTGIVNAFVICQYMYMYI